MKKLFGAGGQNRTGYARLFQRQFGLSHLPDKNQEVGRSYRIIVGTHLLVSTPSRKLKPFLAWLGVVLKKEFPRIHPIIQSALRRKAPKIQGDALPMSYSGSSQCPSLVHPPKADSPVCGIAPCLPQAGLSKFFLTFSAYSGSAQEEFYPGPALKTKAKKNFTIF